MGAWRPALEAHPRTRRPLTIRRAIAIWVRCAGTCGLCRLPVPPAEVDFDHIVPISRGGADTDDNLQVAHVRCNRTRNAHSADLLEYMSDERAAAAA